MEAIDLITIGAVLLLGVLTLVVHEYLDGKPSKLKSSKGDEMNREDFEELIQPEMEKWKEEMWEKFKDKVEEPVQEEPVPGEWYLTTLSTNSNWFPRVFNGKVEGDYFFRSHMEPGEPIRVTNWKPLIPKPLATLWMATDEDGETFLYSKPPIKRNVCFSSSEGKGPLGVCIGKNIGGQTFDDGPWEVEIRIKSP